MISAAESKGNFKRVFSDANALNRIFGPQNLFYPSNFRNFNLSDMAEERYRRFERCWKILSGPDCDFLDSFFDKVGNINLTQLRKDLFGHSSHQRRQSKVASFPMVQLCQFQQQWQGHKATEFGLNATTMAFPFVCTEAEVVSTTSDCVVLRPETWESPDTPLLSMLDEESGLRLGN